MREVMYICARADAFGRSCVSADGRKKLDERHVLRKCGIQWKFQSD